MYIYIYVYIRIYTYSIIDKHPHVEASTALQVNTSSSFSAALPWPFRGPDRSFLWITRPRPAWRVDDLRQKTWRKSDPNVMPQSYICWLTLIVLSYYWNVCGQLKLGKIDLIKASDDLLLVMILGLQPWIWITGSHWHPDMGWSKWEMVSFTPNLPGIKCFLWTWPGCFAWITGFCCIMKIHPVVRCRHTSTAFSDF